MQTFAQKPKATQQTESTESMNSGPPHLRQSREVDSIIHLQRTIGNRAVQRMMGATTLPNDFGQMPASPKLSTHAQPTLRVSPAGDVYEEEADRISEQVMNIPALPPMVASEDAQRQSLQKDNVFAAKPLGATLGPLVQRAPSDLPGTFEPSADFASRLSTDGSGNALPAATRAFMEPRFGADFSGVRLHTGSEAAHLSRAIGAQAFTHGQDIYLGEGKDDLESSAGKQLLAHELTHTIQQAATGHREGGLVQRSWTGDRIDWVRSATHEDNWASPDPPGAYYVLNGLSMDDMVRVLRALTSADRKKLSDNLDEHAAGFDRSRLQLGLTNAAAPASDKAFREQSENLLWAIRSGNYANPPDGAFYLLAATKRSERDRLIAALNRDALDVLIAHGAEAVGVPGGAELVSAISRKRGIGGPSNRERLDASIEMTNDSTLTPAKLKAMGYRFKDDAGGVPKWVHPSGKELWLLSPSTTAAPLPQSPTGGVTPEPAPPIHPDVQAAREWADNLEARRNELWKEAIRLKQMRNPDGGYPAGPTNEYYKRLNRFDSDRTSILKDEAPLWKASQTSEEEEKEVEKHLERIQKLNDYPPEMEELGTP